MNKLEELTLALDKGIKEASKNAFDLGYYWSTQQRAIEIEMGEMMEKGKIDEDFLAAINQYQEAAVLAAKFNALGASIINLMHNIDGDKI